jgi:predicted metal-dependent phosphotriesterase family hydrolase
MEGLVRTVVGDVAPQELGPTYGHEHLLTRPAGEQPGWPTRTPMP